MKISPVALFNKWNAALLAALKPFGAWGICGLSLLDSAAIPMPIDAIVIDYVAHEHGRFLLYCFMAALGSAFGSLLPFLLGRAGGELFLLKRINRARYEQLRDRFERQEFLAIMIPAMMPPPMPVKVFEFAAGVFEMRTISFFGAMLLGKFLRFLTEALITIFYGPTIMRTATAAVQNHLGYVLAVCGVLVLLLAFWVARKIFDVSKGVKLPVEEETDNIPE